ncbi:MAG: ATP-dependent zinc protease [Pseudomonadales bacterium]|nr:ATP-dependent zinc protease [Pseudomonadales bacterium]MCP5185669.1 ATP-dependent zinc protease [Pseudomonadales bacterium]
MIRARILPIAAMAFLIGGCSTLSQGQSTQIETRLQQLRMDMAAMQREFARTRESLQASSAAGTEDGQTLAQRLDTVQATLETLPSRIDMKCPAPAPAAKTAECKAPPPIRVESSQNKTLVGEKERIRLDPPGALFVARIDTGATSSSLHAENLVKFERDGEDWVRFDVAGEAGSIQIEAPIVRYARVIQQADPKGDRRPVVSLRVRLGEIDESVEFTLADRSHLENELLLGRSFLTDLAIVDVSREFIQPAPK